MIDKLGGYEAIHRPKQPVKCASCGKFIGLDQFDDAHCDYEPLSEYGPERIEWICGRCVKAGRV